MKFKAFMLFLSMTALVLTTGLSTAGAEEENLSTACTLSYVDVYCAEHIGECRDSSVLSKTSINADFSFPKPKFNFYQPSPIPENDTGVKQSEYMQSTTLDSEKLFQLVNSYRQKVGLSAFEKNPELCAVAESRGSEIRAEVINGNIHGGMRRRNLPYFVTENMKWGGNEEQILAWWLNSPLHASAINGDDKYACTMCSGSGCIMLFTSFVSKGGVATAPFE